MTHPAYKHGQSNTPGKPGTPSYFAWASMHQRCSNPNNPNYPRYGGRGIKVCARWSSFENFFADMGERPKGMSLDREDNEGNYTPNNCRWATMRTQANNTRRNIKITIDGQTRTLSEWCLLTGVDRSTAHKRISRSGWNPERAVSTPALWSRQ